MRKLNKSDIKIEEWEFQFQQRNEHRILFADIWSRALYYELESEMKLSVGSQDSLFLSDSTCFIKKGQRRKIFQLLKEVLEKDDKYLEYVYQKTLERINEYKEFADRFLKELTKNTELSKEKLAEYWKEHDDLITKVIPWFYIPWYITESNILSDRVKKGLEKHKNKIKKITDISHALLTLITPVKLMMFQEEQKDFYNLVKNIEAKEDFENNIFLEKANKYLASHAWIKTFVFLPLEHLTIERLVEEIKEALQQKALDEYKMRLHERKKNSNIIEKLLKLFKEDKNLIKDINWAREYGWLLTYSVEFVLKTAAQLHPLYKLISKKLKIGFDDFSHLTSAEILRGLNGNFQVSEKKLEKRKRGYAFLFQNKEFKMTTGKKALEITDWVQRGIVEAKKDVKEFNGQAASPGQAKGNVKIALTPEDASNVLAGEILVCPMTSPGYVPAMQKAGAVVTDEGGLLSHAAIISRELGKPCIVGAKVASRILKTGDEVEVDADNGVVRILKKK